MATIDTSSGERRGGDSEPDVGVREKLNSLLERNIRHFREKKQIVENMTLADSYEFFSSKDGILTIAYDSSNENIYMSYNGSKYYELKHADFGNKKDNKFSYFDPRTCQEISFEKKGDKLTLVGLGAVLSKIQKPQRTINVIKDHEEFSSTLSDGRLVRLISHNNHTRATLRELPDRDLLLYKLVINGIEVKIKSIYQERNGSWEVETESGSVLLIPGGTRQLNGEKPVWKEREMVNGKKVTKGEYFFRE